MGVGSCRRSVHDPVKKPSSSVPIAIEAADGPIAQADVPLVAIPVPAGGIPPGAGGAPWTGSLIDAAAGHAAAIDRHAGWTSTFDANTHHHRGTETAKE